MSLVSLQCLQKDKLPSFSIGSHAFSGCPAHTFCLLVLFMARFSCSCSCISADEQKNGFRLALRQTHDIMAVRGVHMTSNLPIQSFKEPDIKEGQQKLHVHAGAGGRANYDSAPGGYAALPGRSFHQSTGPATSGRQPADLRRPRPYAPPGPPRSRALRHPQGA